jgi:hypothetical protein
VHTLICGLVVQVSLTEKGTLACTPEFYTQLIFGNHQEFCKPNPMKDARPNQIVW